MYVFYYIACSNGRDFQGPPPPPLNDKIVVLANYLVTTIVRLSFLCQFEECGAHKTFCRVLVKFTQVSAPTACIHKICVVRIVTQL